MAITSITRVSTAADGAQGNGLSFAAALSADGRFVAFSSDASNLVAGDNTNRYGHIFVKDLATGAITLASTAADGTQGNGRSYETGLSADGRFVAFTSKASNLVPGDTNGEWDIFVNNLATGAITRASTAADGTQGNYGSDYPTLSADGRFVAFTSSASNLVPGDTNGVEDIFVKDLATGAITRASTAADDTQGNYASDYPTLSADGRFVAFTSSASNLVPGDTNYDRDIFVKDLATGAITRANTAADGTQGNDRSYDTALSADGRFVAFRSHARNLVPGNSNDAPDIFVKDLATGAIERVSTDADGTESNGRSEYPALSADGTKVAFTSDASNLVAADTNDRSDIFVVTLGDAPPPTGSYSIAPASVTVDEGDGTVSFTVARSVTTAGETLYASTVQNQGFTNAGDYVGLLNEPVAFAAGEASKAVTVQIIDDAIPEADETFGLIIQKSASDPVTNSLASASFTIEDNDSAPPTASYSISPQNATVREDAGTVTFTVARSDGSQPQTVYVSTIDGALGYNTNNNDFATKQSAALSFKAGEEWLPIKLDIYDSILGEPDETFGLYIHDEAGKPAGQRARLDQLHDQGYLTRAEFGFRLWRLFGGAWA